MAGIVARPEIAEARRLVIKVGTRVLRHDDGSLALSRMCGIIEAAVNLSRQGRQVLLVSSGAVGMGKDALGLERIPEDLEERQACAAVGQTRLMGLYEQGFARLGLVCGQVLLTRSDFDDRVRYLNLRSTLVAMMRHDVIPIINENDAVSTDELAYVEGAQRPVFGDNDQLSALVAAKLDADLLVLLTDVEGVFDKDPRQSDDARLLSRIEDLDELDLEHESGSPSVSRGGMRSKVGASVLAVRAGCHAVIASGFDPTALERLFAGEEVGTWIPAGESLAARHRWIAFAAVPRGTLELDAGAVTAVRERGASVLAAGVRGVEGHFKQGDIVELRGPDGKVVGRGMVFCDSATACEWCGGTPPSGVRNHHALVHRDHLVLEV